MLYTREMKNIIKEKNIYIIKEKKNWGACGGLENWEIKMTGYANVLNTRFSQDQ